MDLGEVETLARPAVPGELPAWRAGDAALAGGTWVFSEPQPGLRRLVDLSGLGWDGLSAGADGLRIGAMCTLARLAAFEAPAGWLAAPLLRQCCEALAASFKVQAVATVGGNLCLALPAGPMAALAAALQAVCVIRAAEGSPRLVPAEAFVTGDRRTVLGRGELLREVRVPASALACPTAFRRVSLSPLGRTGALVIGTAGKGTCRFTVTGAVTRPVVLAFATVPEAAALAAALACIDDRLWHDDVHGAPDWRRHVTGVLAQEVRLELRARCV